MPFASQADTCDCGGSWIICSHVHSIWLLVLFVFLVNTREFKNLTSHPVPSTSSGLGLGILLLDLARLDKYCICKTVDSVKSADEVFERFADVSVSIIA